MGGESSESSRVPRAVVFGVFSIALSTLFFEVLLTRIFSVTLWYHFGFLAISLALLGTAASAVLCFLYPERLAGDRHLQNMAISALAFGIAAPASVVHHVTTRLPGFEDMAAFFLGFGLQLILLFISFFSGGMCISIALFRYSSRIGAIYSFDLVGAALGSLLVVPFMYQWSPMALVFVVAAVAFAAATGFVRSSAGSIGVQTFLLLAVGASLTIALLNDSMQLVQISSIKSYSRRFTQQAKPESLWEKWSPVSRVSVEQTTPDWASSPVLVATNDAGAPTVLFQFHGDDYESAAVLFERDSTLCAFQFKTDAKVLVIGVGGGRDVQHDRHDLTPSFWQRRIRVRHERPGLQDAAAGDVVAVGPLQAQIGQLRLQLCAYWR